MGSLGIGLTSKYLQKYIIVRLYNIHHYRANTVSLSLLNYSLYIHEYDLACICGFNFHHGDPILLEQMVWPIAVTIFHKSGSNKLALEHAQASSTL